MRIHTTVLSLVALTLAGVLPAFSQKLVPEGSPDFVAIEQLLLDVDSTWNRRDAKGFSDLFLEDADFRFYTGQMLRGRKEIEQFFTASFAELPADLRHETRGEHYRYLTPDLIIGDSVIFVYPEGATEEQAHSRPILSTGVAMKKDGRWRLATVRLMVPQQE
jgi:uncharacterized protein (TIGR02246 family)